MITPIAYRSSPRFGFSTDEDTSHAMINRLFTRALENLTSHLAHPDSTSRKSQMYGI